MPIYTLSMDAPTVETLSRLVLETGKTGGEILGIGLRIFAAAQDAAQRNESLVLVDRDKRIVSIVQGFSHFPAPKGAA